MVEICAAYPSAGSVYHWTAQLVPKDKAAIASYICGWSNLIGTGFPETSGTHGYIGVMGLLVGIYSFIGFEASAHMAEDTHGARNTAPKGVVYTVFATAAGGLLILFPLLALMNVDEANRTRP